jgi:uncharacterized protein YbgA (DUF1722 family)/uncharacterized protein YbbK (DUF523 family)
MTEPSNTTPKPRVVVSKCLGFAACRYNGLTIPDDFVDQLGPWVEYMPVCAEVEIGLGVPRQPVRVVTVAGADRVLQPATGADVTEAMTGFAESFLGALPPVEGFILKTRSPSCGIKDVRIYMGPDKGAASRTGAGMFGRAVLERFPGAAIEDEGRLRNARIREHFMTKLFALARFREVKESGSFRELVRYQAQSKLLLMTYHQVQMRVLGKLVANHERRPFAEVSRDYERGLQQALLRGPRCTATINTLMHALGYFSDGLSAGEKGFFLDLLERYRSGKVLLSAVNQVLRSWIVRFDEEYLASQVFFAPYPEALVDASLAPDACSEGKDYWKHADGPAG